MSSTNIFSSLQESINQLNQENNLENILTEDSELDASVPGEVQDSATKDDLQFGSDEEPADYDPTKDPEVKDLIDPPVHDDEADDDDEEPISVNAGEDYEDDERGTDEDGIDSSAAVDNEDGIEDAIEDEGLVQESFDAILEQFHPVDQDADLQAEQLEIQFNQARPGMGKMLTEDIDMLLAEEVDPAKSVRANGNYAKLLDYIQSIAHQFDQKSVSIKFTSLSEDQYNEKIRQGALIADDKTDANIAGGKNKTYMISISGYHLNQKKKCTMSFTLLTDAMSAIFAALKKDKMVEGFGDFAKKMNSFKTTGAAVAEITPATQKNMNDLLSKLKDQDGKYPWNTQHLDNHLLKEDDEMTDDQLDVGAAKRTDDEKADQAVELSSEKDDLKDVVDKEAKIDEAIKFMGIDEEDDISDDGDYDDYGSTLTDDERADQAVELSNDKDSLSDVVDKDDALAEEFDAIMNEAKKDDEESDSDKDSKDDDNKDSSKDDEDDSSEDLDDEEDSEDKDSKKKSSKKEKNDDSDEDSDDEDEDDLDESIDNLLNEASKEGTMKRAAGNMVSGFHKKMPAIANSFAKFAKKNKSQPTKVTVDKIRKNPGSLAGDLVGSAVGSLLIPNSFVASYIGATVGSAIGGAHKGENKSKGTMAVTVTMTLASGAKKTVRGKIQLSLKKQQAEKLILSATKDAMKSLKEGFEPDLTDFDNEQAAVNEALLNAYEEDPTAELEESIQDLLDEDFKSSAKKVGKKAVRAGGNYVKDFNKRIPSISKSIAKFSKKHDSEVKNVVVEKLTHNPGSYKGYYFFGPVGLVVAGHRKMQRKDTYGAVVVATLANGKKTTKRGQMPNNLSPAAAQKKILEGIKAAKKLLSEGIDFDLTAFDEAQTAINEAILSNYDQSMVTLDEDLDDIDHMDSILETVGGDTDALTDTDASAERSELVNDDEDIDKPTDDLDEEFNKIMEEGSENSAEAEVDDPACAKGEKTNDNGQDPVEHEKDSDANKDDANAEDPVQDGNPAEAGDLTKNESLDDEGSSILDLLI